MIRKADVSVVSGLRVDVFGKFKYQRQIECEMAPHGFCKVQLKDVSVTGTMSLLEVAAAHGWLDVCKELIKKCSLLTSSTSLKVNQPELATRSPLHYAAWEGHLDVVQFLTESCEVEIDGGKGSTPLTLAIECGQVEVVKHLVSTCESNPNKPLYVMRSNQNSITPFCYACALGQVEIMRYILSLSGPL